MRSWMIAFCLGILLGGTIPGLPDPRYLPLLFIPLILSLRFPALSLSSAYCLGLFWVLNWAVDSLDQILPPALERKDFWVRGEIVSLPEFNVINSQFIFKVENTCFKPIDSCDYANDLLRGQLIQLSLYQQIELSPGQRWQFKVRLKRPHGFLNPGGFDYEAWLWQKEIRASGYVREDAANYLIAQSTALNFQALRYRFTQKLEKQFPDGRLQHLNLIRALSIGDRQGINNKDWDLFSATGTNHLMVISGMHLGFVAFLLYCLSKHFLKRIGNLALYLPAPRLAAIIATTGAYIYAGMAGFALPVQRAFIMLTAFMLAQCCCRHSSVTNSYCLALTLVLLLNPLAPVSSGFWLSFMAVGILVFFIKQNGSRQTSSLAKITALFKTQLTIFIGLLPFMLLFFQQSSLAAPFVNLLAIPFVTLLLVPLCLLILFFSFISTELMTYFCLCADRLFAYFMSALQLANQHWPEAVIVLPSLNAWQWAALLIIISLLLYSLSLRRQWLALTLICIVPVVFISRNELDINEFQLDILDVGQGLALVIRTSEHAMLYDLGPAYSESFNAGEGIILPFLRSQNITQIDKVLVSHTDNDHIGGLSPILMAFPEAEYLSSDLSRFPAEYKSKLCRAGQHWRWDGVEFQILHPDTEGYSRNNSSCVLKVSNAKHAVLLTGDIESLVERRLLRSGYKLDVDILIAPHHGSKTSSHRGFVEATSPTFVVFSSGYLNQFRHPHPDIVKLYTNSGTIDLNSAQNGTISWLIALTDDLEDVSRYREANKRFWRVIPKDQP